MVNILFKILVILLITSADLCAKGFDLTKQNSNDDIEITADNSLEWQRKEQVIIADGNALAKKGSVSLKADRLNAFYKIKNKKNDIYMVSGNKNVVIKNLTESAFGNNIIYDIEKGVMVLKGTPAKAIVKGNIITSDVFEYWQFQNMAVARGNAKVVKDDGKTITAKIITAHFEDADHKTQNKDKKQDNSQNKLNNQLEIERIDLFDDIIFTSENEQIYADRARYNLKTMVIRLEGNIKIVRGKSILTGAYATVNMNTGISKLFKKGEEKVKGVFIPEEYKSPQK